MSGELGDLYQKWKKELMKIVAHIEAFIDFSEDENIEGNILDQAMKSLKVLKESIAVHLRDNRRGERLRSGVRIAIVGEPNAGKSSLLNLLCRRPAAIVTPIAGTTRDVVESAVNLGGYPVLFGDTAGIRETEDVVEVEGVRRAMERAQNSDIVVMVVDVSALQPFHEKDFSACDLRQTVLHKVTSLRKRIFPEEILQSISEKEAFESSDESNSGRDITGSNATSSHTLILLNKVDLLTETQRKLLEEATDYPTESQRRRHYQVSCKTSDGVDNFLKKLTRDVSEMCGDPLSGNPSLTQQRHRTHLEDCLSAMSKVELDGDLVIDAEHLREALRQLGRITGHVGVEEVLDIIFKDFCIGK